MPKAKIEFDLENFDELTEFRRVVNCANAYMMIGRFEDFLRKEKKYMEHTEHDEEFLEKICVEWYDLAYEYKINLNE